MNSKLFFPQLLFFFLGMVVASGVLGSNLKGNPDVFVSTNAGIGWKIALPGPYLYAMADQGGIIAAIHLQMITKELLWAGFFFFLNTNNLLLVWSHVFDGLFYPMYLLHDNWLCVSFHLLAKCLMIFDYVYPPICLLNDNWLCAFSHFLAYIVCCMCIVVYSLNNNWHCFF